MTAATPMPTPRRGPTGHGKKGEFPPGPPGLPFIGVAVGFSADPLQRMTEWTREYGDVVHWRVPRAHLFLVAHPDDIASVLVGDHAQYMKDDLTHELARFVGRGLLTSEGSFWRRQRRIAAPSFQPRHISGFADTMVARTLAAVDRWPASSHRDVHADMMHLTLDIVLDTLFGEAQVPSETEVGEIVGLLMAGFQSNYLTWRRMLPDWVNRAQFDSLDRARERLDAILYGIIRARREERRDRDDVLGRLIAARDEDGSRMTDRQLRDEVATLFLAGHETTALALSFALDLLARNPAAAETLEAEVDRVLGKRTARLQDVAALAYTDAVVRESMRLYPPAYAIGREALEDREVAGWVIPRGAQVLVPQWVVHRDARWFADPDAFRPERWLDGLEARLPRFAYFPFGGGARVCVGNHFAMLEAVLALATIAQHARVHPSGDARIELSPSVTLRPKAGVYLAIERRR
jgi:cytochrome P450